MSACGAYCSNKIATILYTNFMHVLIVYATYSAGTQVASEIIERELAQKGHMVTRKKAEEAKVEEFDSYDLVVLGSPSWLQDKHDGQPHQLMIEFLETLKSQNLAGRRFAVFGLGDRDFARFTYAVDIIQDTIKKQQGTLVTEPLRIDSFWFKEKENEEMVTSWAASLSETLKT